MFHQSPQPLLDYIVRPVKNKQSTKEAIAWFNRQTNLKNSVRPLTNVNSTTSKLDNSTMSNENSIKSDSKGLPNAEQLDHVYNKLGEDVSNQLSILVLLEY